MEQDSNLAPVNVHTQLAELIAFSRTSVVAMGRLLRELKLDDNFRTVVGEGIDTWNAYLAQPEIGLSKGEADRLIQIYEYFVIKFGISEDQVSAVPIKNLHYLLPIAKNTDDVDMISELIGDAEHLSQRDFRERIQDVKSGEDGVRTYEYLVMRKCVETGSMQKVHSIDSDTVKDFVREHNERYGFND